VLSATPNQTFSDLAWRTDDGGTTWSQAWLPDAQSGLSANSISCVDALHCVSVQRLATTGSNTSVVERTANGGITWTEESLPNGTGAELLFVNCSDVTDCAVGGFTGSGNQPSNYDGTILESTDGGLNWSQSHLPQGLGSVDDISCPARGTCFAIGGPSPSSPTAQDSQEVLTNEP
jgi:photosystem II stability/assembly factor-like uncharacterized protein